MGLDLQKSGEVCRCNEKNLPSHSALHDQQLSNSAGQPVRARPHAKACVDSCDQGEGIVVPSGPGYGVCMLSQMDASCGVTKGAMFRNMNIPSL